MMGVAVWIGPDVKSSHRDRLAILEKREEGGDHDEADGEHRPVGDDLHWPLARAGTVEQAAAFGDVVVMVVPYSALEEIGKAHGRALATKPLVMDVCNPIARRDGEAIVKWANEQGGAGLASAKLLPGARIVRAFNAISYRRVGEIAHRAGGLVGVPIAGDDPKAIALAEGLIRGIGFEPVLVGGLAMGKYLLPGTPLAEDTRPLRFDRSPPACAESRPSMAEPSTAEAVLGASRPQG